jgi:hypothetical protein
MNYFPMRATCPAHIIFHDVIIIIIFGEEISYQTPRYAVLSNPLSLHLSSAEMFSPAPCSQTPSVYVPPLMSETKFHTHTDPQVIL